MSKSELFKARELRIQKAALETIQHTGALEFRMADVAQAAECSVGTIYGHFLSKEDLMASLVQRRLDQRQAWIDDVMQGDVAPLYRFMLLLWGDNERVEQSESQFHMEQLITHTDLWLRVSDSRQKSLTQSMTDLQAALVNCLQKAVAEQGLSLSEERLAILVEQVRALILGRQLQIRCQARMGVRGDDEEKARSMTAIKALLSDADLVLDANWEAQLDAICAANPYLAEESPADAEALPA